MQVYIGAPQQALWNTVFASVGSQPCWVIVPSGVPPLPIPPNAEQMDTRALLARFCDQPHTLEVAPEHTACMAQVCKQVLTPSSYFAKVSHLPGFHRQLVRRFTEWHLDGINPDTLERGAQQVLETPPETLDEQELQDEWQQKTDEMVNLWREWRKELERQNLLEPAQVWWQVIGALRSDPPENLRPCLWLGFTQLRMVERALLKVLDVHASQHFALLCDEERPDLFLPTLKLYEALKEAILVSTHYLPKGMAVSSNPLGELEPRLWTSQPSPPPASLRQAITVLDVPNPLMELETIAREILHLLNARDYTHGDIALLLRQPAGAIEMLEVVFERYGIPFTGEVSLPLSRSHLVGWVMHGLRLLVGREPWQNWVDWFRHPLFGFSPLQIRRLESLRGVQKLSDALNQYNRRYPEDTECIQWLQTCLNLQGRVGSAFHEVILRLASHIPPNELPDEAESDELPVLLQLAKAYQAEVQPLTPVQALAYLERLVAGSTYTKRWRRQGVRLLNPEHSDLMGAKVVFLISVLEGVYPYRHPDEPFLRESERLALREALQPPPNLVTRTELQAGEPLLFYRALTTARERLYLSSPRTQNDSDALPSFYLKELERVLGETLLVRTLTLGQIVPPLEQCLHPYDRALSTKNHPYEEPSDQLSEPTLHQAIANLNREFSVSELESLVRCPFQHLMRYILRVRVPRRGLQIMQVGTVLHQSLYHLLSQSNDPDQWEQQLVQVLQNALQNHLDDLSDWQKQVVQAYALRMLEMFIAREPTYRQQFRISPFRLEWVFGNPHDLEDEERSVVVPSNQGQVSCVPYQVAPGLQIALRGVMDRVDLTDDRSALMIVDYKLSGAPDKSQFKEGRALQFLIYADVARALLAQNNCNRKVLIACDSLAKGTRTRYLPHDSALIQRFRQMDKEPSGVCQIFSQGEWNRMFHNLRDRLRHALQRLAQVEVAPTPDRHCQMCAYGDVCRRSQFLGGSPNRSGNAQASS